VKTDNSNKKYFVVNIGHLPGAVQPNLNPYLWCFGLKIGTLVSSSLVNITSISVSLHFFGF